MKALPLCQVRLMLLWPLLVVFMVTSSVRDYAYAIESIPEATFKQETLKFGTKIPRAPTSHRSAVQSSTVAATTYRHNEIPVIYKNLTTTASSQLTRGTLNYASRSRSNNHLLKPTRSSDGELLSRSKANYSIKSDSITTTPTIRPRKRVITRITKTTITSTTVPLSTTTIKATTSKPTFASNFPLGNAFNFFNLWNLSNPPTTKKPPKKYAPPQVIDHQTLKVDKNSNKLSKNASKSSKIKEVLITPKPNYRTTSASSSNQPKLLITTTLRTTSISTQQASIMSATTIRPKVATMETPEEGPFRIALPTLNFSNPISRKQQLVATIGDKDKGKRAIDNADPRARFNCPRESEVRFQLFPKICENDSDCGVWQKDELCCDIFGAKSCVNGIAKPLEEYSHSPILGLIERKCPSRPLAELWWEVKECQSDMDCWPRVCCPDGRRRYCRTSQPQLETAPVQVKRSFNYLSEYLECTPPPPPIFDLHPKACTSTFDCFPNVCCQEAGLRHCRPPKKSLLTWMANFLNVDFVKRFTQNIVIK